MKIVADLQIHSKHARATSKNLSIVNLEKWGRIKGIDLLGVGDFQHPEHRKDIDAELYEDKKGILRTKTGYPFIWQTEVSLMFSQGGKRRAVHLLIYAPNRKIADKVTAYLGSKGRLDYDGRPIFGISCRDIVKELKEIEEKIEIIPAHCMTPWFGLFGSGSGFDSIAEAFEDQTHHIYAVESGISADPSMLARFPEISSGKVNVVSFSDAHSHWPWRLGREATIFEVKELSYDAIMKAIRTGDGIDSTIETPPAYGKYHWDGHRTCEYISKPANTKKLNGICPKCKKKMIIGVDYRVEELAQYPDGHTHDKMKPYYSVVPLHELIAIATNTKGLNTKKVWTVYNQLIKQFKTELAILTQTPKKELKKAIPDHEVLVDLIIGNRKGTVKIKPGYDGVYGKLSIAKRKKKK